MKIRPFNIDRMRRHVARSTPDRIDKVITMEEAWNETKIHRLFIPWVDKMRIKHLGKGKRIEFFQLYDLEHKDQYIATAQVVNDRYARPINSTRSRL